MRVLCVHHESPIEGGTYDRVISEAGHDIVRWSPFAGEPAPSPGDADAIVVYGGAVHPDADGTEPWLAEEVTFIAQALDQHVPVLGLCLGAQLIARATGAWVGPAQASEVGWYRVEPTDSGHADPVVGALGGPTHAFEWHHYTYDVPVGATELARSERATQAFRFGDRTWGVQFHPEVTREMVYEWSGLAPDQVEGDVEVMRAETDRRIAGWTETGRRLCLAFLEQAGSDQKVRPRAG